jgi:hypothetical protein
MKSAFFMSQNYYVFTIYLCSCYPANLNAYFLLFKSFIAKSIRARRSVSVRGGISDLRQKCELFPLHSRAFADAAILHTEI